MYLLFLDTYLVVVSNTCLRVQNIKNIKQLINNLSARALFCTTTFTILLYYYVFKHVIDIVDDNFSMYIPMRVYE